MDMINARQNGRRDVLAEFKDILRQYTHIGACGREFIRVQKLKEWLRTGKNTRKLLEVAYRPMEVINLPIGVDRIHRGTDCALLVFSILLDLGQGALIHFFKRAHLLDQILPLTKYDLEELYKRVILDPRYRDVIGDLDVASLERRFSARQYAFIPITFELGSDGEYTSDWIIPVTAAYSTLINEKGRTASVFQISIMEDFIGDDLRTAIQEDSRFNVKHDNNEDITYYRMALKQFKQDDRQSYQTEKEAFQALGNQEGMIRYLSDFEHKTGNRFNYNILLEYGQHDLDEFFFDPGTNPPVLSEEINGFWRDIIDVAGALKDIHRFQVQRDDVMHQYYGWHADIKPDNILKVNGKFKLADPGFASFKKVQGEKKLEDTTLVRGGTVTFGAPECQFVLRQRKQVLASRAIDIWSLGCVFSVAATWVVLGQQGIGQFTFLRQEAISTLIDAAPEGQSILMGGDYFHDGTKVLPIVGEWHKYLRHCMRASDKVTGKILDIIDNNMLCQEKARITAFQLHKELIELVQNSADSVDQLSQDFRNALRDLDVAISAEQAPLEPSLLLPLESTSRALSVKDRMDRESRLLAVPLKRTTHRSNASHNQSQAISQASISYSAIDPETATTRPPISTIVVPDTSSRPSERLLRETTQMNPSYAGANSTRDSMIINSGIMSAPTMSATMRRSTGGTVSSDVQRTVPAPSRLPKQNPWQARAELDRRQSGVAARTGRIMGRAPKKDDFLSFYFGKRDLHYLVDNGSSMFDYWDEATWLLRILLEKSVGQDENGMDMSFMNGPIKVNGSNKVEDFIKKMGEAKPPKYGVHTDACTQLGEILQKYLIVLREQHERGIAKLVRKLAIVVLTDGRWEGIAEEKKDAIGKKIAKFAKDMEAAYGESLRERQVSFQFIRFGKDEEARSRLRRLDDELPLEETIPDIVDTTDSTGDVNKMLLGSFVELYDRVDNT